MGAWSFCSPILHSILERYKFKNNRIFYAGRKESASTATGLFKRHVVEQNELINTIFAKV